jgi:branched-chain amino acid transport system ATP-binding protein
MSAEMLKVSGLQMRFGGLLAVDGIEFDVRRDEVFAIIGPNGAGKTTVFNCVGGFYKPTAGEIMLDGHSIARLPSHQVARRGLVRTFQNIRLFKQLTVVENLWSRSTAGEGRSAARVAGHAGLSPRRARGAGPCG